MATASLTSACAVTDTTATEAIVGTWKRVGGELRCQEYLPGGVFKEWWRGDSADTHYQAGTWSVNEGQVEVLVLDSDALAPQTTSFATIESLGYGSLVLRGSGGETARYERVAVGVDGPCTP